MNEDLNKLEGEAAAADLLVAPAAETQPLAEPEQSAPQVDRMGEAAMIVGLLRPAVGMVFAAVKAAPDEEWTALQEPIAELLAFYNVDVTKYLNSPWARLAGASVPLVLRVWMAAEEEEEGVPEKTPGDKPDAATSSAGGPEPVFAARG